MPPTSCLPLVPETTKAAQRHQVDKLWQFPRARSGGRRSGLRLGGQSLTLLAFSACLLCAGAGCLLKRNEMGVQNKWRDASLPSFEKGRTTESDVMRALG